MAILSSWQKISRVLGGDWGDGASGSATISSDPNTRATITGTATQTTGTAGSTAFANGDLVLLIQYQGTGAGQYEWNMVASGGGTTSLTFNVALQYTYGTGAQIIKVPRYVSATVSAHSPTAWNGTTGGIEVICANSVTISGALNGNGLGFVGGPAKTDNSTTIGGEGISGDGVRAGGAAGTANAQGGAGGAYAANGDNSPAGSAGGLSYGSADLTAISAGGSGGGASGGTPGGEGAGGGSGAILAIFAETITVSAAVSSNGAAGANGSDRGGGGGSGGAVLLVCRTASVGTGSITATAGAYGTGVDANARGGAGSVGRIAIHHSGTVTGTTSPTFTDVTDTTLHGLAGGAFIFNLL